MSSPLDLDAYSPPQIARRIEEVGVAKARLPAPQLLALGVLGGGFIGLGGLFATVATAGSSLSFGGQRCLGGLTFSLGLVLVSIAGAELFTGNNLLVMAWVAGRLRTREVLRSLVLSYVANFVGAAGLALLVAYSGHADLGNGVVGAQMLSIARAKCDLLPLEAFLRGVLCNVLVCLAIWMAMAGRSVVDRVVAIVLPVAAFVAAGFEHSVANMYLIPVAILAAGRADAAASEGVPGWLDFASQLVPVTLGNLVGGCALVALVYALIYGRRSPLAAERRESSAASSTADRGAEVSTTRQAPDGQGS